ncbi:MULTISPECIES: hypothetical protein [Microbacterium]|uniref:Major facilitator superfamily (MFS) profile domain-containing protein n=1 Tax=Microbacterium aquilitoris TaxID=3067307 RepID=A0ABU3GH62_9MICO|nr:MULTISPECIES: hypothetical protein [unclassified Microbacterium]MDT3330039.1 hypothetical protein [Microbacterium sp. KSW-18]MDT3345871.1 hypothetical protein [Microbacterium sp. KSW2-22]
MSTPAPPQLAQRAWGIAAVAIVVLSVLPTLLVLVLVATVDEQYGWLLILTFALLVAGGSAAMLAGIVGLVFAGIRRRGFVWPAAGTVLGIALVGAASIILAVGS